jgi:two-component system chemotaxis response regulator CheY
MSFSILVVDDSAVMRSIIIRTLRLSGLPLREVYQAANGAEGLEKLSQNWVDLVFIDLNMPIMDGEEMIERIKSNPDTADLEIVVVSTEGSDTRIEQLRQKGIEFIHKPFVPEEFREKVFNLKNIQYNENATTPVTGDGFDF